MAANSFCNHMMQQSETFTDSLSSVQFNLWTKHCHYHNK